MPDNKLEIKLQVKNQKANKALKDTENAVKGVEEKAKGTEKQLGRMRIATSGLRRTMGALRNNLLLVSFAFGGTVAALGKTVKAYGEQQLAEKKLESALGKTNQALLDQASALQSVTTFGDENIIQAQALIAAFTDDEEAIKAATRATLDLAAAKGMDLFAAADLVAKTLGSSTNAMSRYGIEVTGAVGSTERLDTLTKNIANTFGGQAKAQADTMTGSIQQMSNAVGDAAEAIGETLSPAVIMVANVVKVFAESIGDLFQWRESILALAKDAKMLSEAEFAFFKLKSEVEDMTRPEIIERMRSLGAVVGDFENSSVELGDVMGFVTEETSLNHDMLKILFEAYQTAPGAVDEFALHLEDFRVKQQKTLDNYNLEQELIAGLIAQYPLLANQLGLVTDATKDQEKADKLAIKTKEDKLKAESALLKGSAALLKQFAGGYKVAARLQQTAAGIDAWSAANAAIAPPPKGYGPTPVGWTMFAASIASGLANVMSISKSIGEFKTAATGMNEVVSSPTMILAGEAGAEQVSITPLEGPNIDGPQGGGGITVNVSGNVLSQDFVEGELAENIKEAIRRGTDFGIT